MTTLRKITKEELAVNNTEQSCWLAIEGKVYDVTSFLEEHPGGKKTVLNQVRAALDF